MPADDSAILFSIDGGVARIVFNRPAKLNAFTIGMHGALTNVLDRAAAGPEVRVLVITGAGRAFSAGQDLSERDVASGAPLDLGHNIEALYNPLVRKLLALPFPLVCAVNGIAAGAGANIALLGDIVVAKRSARFIESFINIGLMPDSGGTWTLAHLAGQARAMGMALTGEPIEADRAEQWGLIWKSIADETFDAEVEALLKRLAAAPTSALLETKRAIRAAASGSLDQQLDLERDAQRRLGNSVDYREGVSAFKSKRTPRFVGH
jgi:2-(1,2-epoxy-1,2-dihydrophenyl)acetyl-CoA isomerase